MKKIFTLSLILLSFAFNFSAAQETAAQTDSVNIKQMIMAQIRNAEQKKARALQTDFSGSVKTGEKTQTPAKAAGSFLDMIPDGYLLKGFLIMDAFLSAVLFVVWRRRKLKTEKLEKTILKTNILKLRQEKVGRKSHLILDKKRKQLKLPSVYDAADDVLVRQARKLSVSVGELQLAARIQSYERDRG